MTWNFWKSFYQQIIYVKLRMVSLSIIFLVLAASKNIKKT